MSRVRRTDTTRFLVFTEDKTMATPSSSSDGGWTAVAMAVIKNKYFWFTALAMAVVAAILVIRSC